MASAMDPKKKKGNAGIVRKGFNNLVMTGVIAAGGLGLAAGGVYVWDRTSQTTDTRKVTQIEEIKTEKCVKVSSTVMTAEGKGQPQQQAYTCESNSEYVIHTEGGNYLNAPNRLRFKDAADVKAIQEKIVVGGTYDFRASGVDIMGQKKSLLDVTQAGSAPAAAATTEAKPSATEPKPADTTEQSVLGPLQPAPSSGPKLGF